MQEVEWVYRQTNIRSSVKMGSLMPKAREVFRKFRISEERTLDGLKLVLSDGSWVMFRPSGTEPITRFYCESRDSQQLEVLVQLGVQCVEASNTS